MGSPLDSPALGSSLSALVDRCDHPRRPAKPDPPVDGPTIGLTFSGGGFRATFAALGVIRYLADADLLSTVRYVSSVSGGSVANGMLAKVWPRLRDRAFTANAVDESAIDPLASRVCKRSLKNKLIGNGWRALGRQTRTDVLAWAFDDWFYEGDELEALDPQCRWIFNAANLTTGVRFAFERDVLGDYVTGLAPTAGTRLRVAEAVAASAAVPGAFAPMRITGIDFPCSERGEPALVDGGAYDNTGLEAIDSKAYQHVFTITLNAGGVFVTGGYGKVPLVRDLARANSLLYRQSTALRTRWMVDRFRAWESSPPEGSKPDYARQGALFGLATTIDDPDRESRLTAEYRDFAASYPEHRSHDGRDLAFVPTVFDKLDPTLIQALVYRGWWLTGASLAQWHPGIASLPANAEAPRLED